MYVVLVEIEYSALYLYIGMLGLVPADDRYFIFVHFTLNIINLISYKKAFLFGEDFFMSTSSDFSEINA